MNTQRHSPADLIINPPRIAILGFRAGAGGIARVMRDLIGGLTTAGAEIDLLLPPGQLPELPPLLAEIGAAITCITLDDANSQLAAQQLRNYLAHRQPTALLSNRDRTHALLAMATVRGQRPPVWLRVGSDMREKIQAKSWLRRWQYRATLCHNYRAADGLIANSNGVADALTALLGNDKPPPLVIIPNPIDRTRIHTLAALPPAHDWLITPTTPIIMSLGRLVAAKDFATLIRAMAHLRHQFNSPARLIIYGEGRQRPALEKLIRQLGLTAAVSLPGFIDNPYSALRHAQVFVLSSRFEGSPNALIEALVCGTPCIATDCRSGPRDMLGNGEYGTLVPVGNVSALARAMAATLAHPPPSTLLMTAAQRFDQTVNAGAYLRTLTTPI